MKNIKAVENNDLDLKATWQELYIITKHWKDDIQFYKDDLKFLQHLINKYLIWITEKENLDKVMEIGKNLLITTKKCNQLIDTIDKHLTHLADLNKNPFIYDYHLFETEHELLENKISDFMKLFRKNKKVAFAITEYVIDNEKLVHYLKR